MLTIGSADLITVPIRAIFKLSLHAEAANKIPQFETEHAALQYGFLMQS